MLPKKDRQTTNGSGIITIHARTKEIVAKVIYLHLVANFEQNLNLNIEQFCPVNFRPNLLNPNGSAQEKIQAIQDFIKFEHEFCTVVDATLPFYFYVNGNLDQTLWQFFNNLFQIRRKNLIPIINEIKRETITVTFDFVEEDGMYIEQEIRQIEWNPKQQRQNDVHVHNTAYFKTAENLIRLGFYNPKEIWDTQYIANNPEIVKQDIANNSKSYAIFIASYFETFIQYVRKHEQELDKNLYQTLEEWFAKNIDSTEVCA